MLGVAILASVVMLAALAIAAYTVRVMSAEQKAHREQLQLAHLEAAQRVRDIVTECFDRIQSRSLVEAVEVAHLRAQREVSVENLKDELAKVSAKPNGVKVRGWVNGEERLFDKDELEPL